MNQDNLINYDENNLIEKDQKQIYIISIVVFAILMLASIIILLFVKESYPLVISLAIGSIISVSLFYVTTKRINQTYYLDFQKQVKKIHLFYQLSYLLSFVILFLLMRNYFTIIGLTVGLLLIRISILLSIIVKKSK